MQENGLIRKINDLTTWETKNCNIHIAECLKKKSNHPNKFGQLIEYNMKSIFPKKPHTKCGGGPFSKISKFNISLDK